MMHLTLILVQESYTAYTNPRPLDINDLMNNVKMNEKRNKYHRLSV